MFANTHQVPLSPPSSPQARERPFRHTEPHNYHHFVEATGPYCERLDRPRSDMQSHQTVPHPVVHPYCDSGTRDLLQESLLYQQRTPSKHAAVSLQLPPAGATNAIGGLTPESTETIDRSAQDDDDDEAIESSGEDPDDTDEARPMTTAERVAAKRKMKRFRLTHSQTRFLMSEFARQAHPDAAHRERLSREIPGLSPRQVQVWFQNRRAKLKRLTNEDQERMMRSRALPPNFDMTQALHAQYGTQGSMMTNPSPPTARYDQYSNNYPARGLTIDTMRKLPNFEPYTGQYVESTGISPAMGSMAFTTPPHSATGQSFGVQVEGGPYDMSRRFGMDPPTTTQSGYPPMLQTPRADMESSGDLVDSPQRTSCSYPALGVGNASDFSLPERTISFPEHTSMGQSRTQLQRSVTTPNIHDANIFGAPFAVSHPSNWQHDPQSTSHNSDLRLPDPYRRNSIAIPSATYGQPSPSHYAPSTQHTSYTSQYSPDAYSNSYSQQLGEPVYNAAPAQPYMIGQPQSAVSYV